MQKKNWTETLKAKHLALDEVLRVELKQLNPDPEEIAKIKRRKLLIKDRLARATA